MNYVFAALAVSGVVSAETLELPLAVVRQGPARAVVNAGDARISVIRPLEREVYRIELSVAWSGTLAAERYFVNYRFPSGYTFADCYRGRDLMSRQQLVLLIPEYRIRQAGFRVGDEVQIAISAERPLARGAGARISNQLALQWNTPRNGALARTRITSAAPTVAAGPRENDFVLVNAVRQEAAASASQDDAERTSQIQARIDADEQLADQDITVTVSGREVELRGTVASEALRDHAKAVARGSDDLEIADHLEVVAPPAEIEPLPETPQEEFAEPQPKDWGPHQKDAGPEQKYAGPEQKHSPVQSGTYIELDGYPCLPAPPHHATRRGRRCR